MVKGTVDLPVILSKDYAHSLSVFHIHTIDLKKQKCINCISKKLSSISMPALWGPTAESSELVVGCKEMKHTGEG